jgi:hypothetical protein
VVCWVVPLSGVDKGETREGGGQMNKAHQQDIMCSHSNFTHLVSWPTHLVCPTSIPHTTHPPTTTHPSPAEHSQLHSGWRQALQGGAAQVLEQPLAQLCGGKAVLLYR